MTKIFKITGDSQGRKVEVTITGDQDLAKELWSFLAGEMIASNTIGAYRSVQSVVQAATKLPKDACVVVAEEHFQAMSIPVEEPLPRRFHKYDEAAPDFGYETRQETRQFDPNSQNGRLMIHVCGKILEDFQENPNSTQSKENTSAPK